MVKYCIRSKKRRGILGPLMRNSKQLRRVKIEQQDAIQSFISRLSYMRIIAVNIEGNRKIRERESVWSLLKWCTLNNLNDFSSKFILKTLHSQAPPKPIYQRSAEKSLE
jgi:hypothetical protein